MFHRDISEWLLFYRYLTVNILELVESTDCKQRLNFEIKFTVLSVRSAIYIPSLSASRRMYARTECTHLVPYNLNHIIWPASWALWSRLLYFWFNSFCRGTPTTRRIKDRARVCDGRLNSCGLCWLSTKCLKLLPF